MLLTITDAGRVAETDALATGSMSPVAAVLIGDGTPHADPQLAAGMVHQIASVPVQVVERVSSQAVRFYATVPQGETVVIREIGLQLADGTLYGYLPYETRVGAPLHKDENFAFSFSLAVSREALPPIEVDYNPLDTGALAADIADQTLSIITDYDARVIAVEVAVSTETQERAIAIAAAEVRALKASLAPHQAVDIDYDEAGNIAGIVETLPSGTRTLVYSYDETGRIAEVAADLDGVVRNETYTYDEAGRLIGMAVVAEDPE